MANAYRCGVQSRRFGAVELILEINRDHFKSVLSYAFRWRVYRHKDEFLSRDRLRNKIYKRTGILHSIKGIVN